MGVMTSVSMSGTSNGTARLQTIWNGSGMSDRPGVGDHAGQRTRCCGRRAGEMGARPGALPADKIAIGRGKTAFARAYVLLVGRQTLGAAWLAPFEPGTAKDVVQAELLGRSFDLLRAGNDPCGHRSRDPTSGCLDDGRCDLKL